MYADGSEVGFRVFFLVLEVQVDGEATGAAGRPSSAATSTVSGTAATPPAQGTRPRTTRRTRRHLCCQHRRRLRDRRDCMVVDFAAQVHGCRAGAIAASLRRRCSAGLPGWIRLAPLRRRCSAGLPGWIRRAPLRCR